VLADGAVVGRFFLSPIAREATPSFWGLAYGHHRDRTLSYGYEPTREADRKPPSARRQRRL
jgi:hypothetical protein